MRVHVVCKLNQARSIIASAALRKIYPNLEIYSSGIQAQSGQHIPEMILEIAERWGLTNLDHSSTLFQSEGPVLKNDLVICADDSIFSKLLKFDLDCNLVNLFDYVLADFLLPSDPVSMPFTEVEIELAKMVLAANRVLQESQLNRKEIRAYIYPQGEELMAVGFINRWFELNQGIAIDMNWRIPDASMWQRLGMNTSFFNPRVPNQLSQVNAKALVSSDFEIDESIDLLTKPQWLNSLEDLALPKLLIISVDGRDKIINPAQIFSLLHVDKLEVQLSFA